MTNNVDALSLLFQMMNDHLKPIARMHSDIINKKYKQSSLVLGITSFYNTDEPITKDDVSKLLDDNKVIGSNKDRLIDAFESTNNLSESGLGIISNNFKNYVAKLVLDNASNIPDPYTALTTLQNYKYEFNSSDQVSKKIECYDLESIDPNKVLEEFGEPIKSSVDAINECFNNGGYMKHQLICVIAPPSVGKSLFLMNEAVKMIQDGHRVCYIAIGDLNKSDFMIRCSAIGLGEPMSKVSENLKSSWDGFKSILGGRLKNFGVYYIDAAEVTSRQLMDYIKTNGLDKKYNIVICDYDTNFKSDSESMYTKGEEIYNDLSNLSKVVDLVFVASQPKIYAFSQELIHMSDAAESGRKSQIVDVMITISKNQNATGTQIGMINLAKVRRNGRSTNFPYMLNPSGRFIPISHNRYKALENDKEQKYAPNKGVVESLDIDDLAKNLGDT